MFWNDEGREGAGWGWGVGRGGVGLGGRRVVLVDVLV